MTHNLFCFTPHPTEVILRKKELQWQVDKLLDKGHVCESLSPCDVPIGT